MGISSIIGGILGFFDDAYDRGYLMYLLIGLIVLFIIIMIFNRS